MENKMSDEELREMADKIACAAVNAQDTGKVALRLFKQVRDQTEQPYKAAIKELCEFYVDDEDNVNEADPIAVVEFVKRRYHDRVKGLRDQSMDSYERRKKLEQELAETEQRVRRETLEARLDERRMPMPYRYSVEHRIAELEEELRRAAESEPKEVRDGK
jgi:hypothetical protein